MKTVTTREFYHNASIVDTLPTGGQLLVTANGKTKFVVLKAGEPPHMTRLLAEKRSVKGGKGKFDGVEFLRTLKK